MITLTKESLKDWSELRKMLPEEILSQYEVQDDKVVLTYEQLKKLSEKLDLSISTILGKSEPSDLNNGIKVSRASEGYKRTSIKNGKEYYTYNHLVTTNVYPTLMPLRVELHVNDNQSVVLNGGHDSTEIVYVTKGTVKMHWENDGHVYDVDLYVGDSAYIHPGISHSFIAAGEDKAELIAINW
ncbi:cupin domain-containing protein [Priestia flexa]|uniref:cupin domain-containing protein n=1 Tax=Priestia flexa TaxID=86664 RepID=UPI00077CA3E4|nr:cupin domain-containing protein [Priestia flexa]MED4590505.1 cupin domain-containing protein [Priestia flexa]